MPLDDMADSEVVRRVHFWQRIRWSSHRVRACAQMALPNSLSLSIPPLDSPVKPHTNTPPAPLTAPCKGVCGNSSKLLLADRLFHRGKIYEVACLSTCPEIFP